MYIDKAGSDPEFFVRNSETHRIVPAHKVVGIRHGKDNPYTINTGKIHYDNVLLEFNTIPATNADEFAANHLNMINEVNELLAINGWELFAAPYLRIPKEVESNPICQEFYCSPDEDIYGTGMPATTITGARTASGNIHVSYVGLKSRNDLINMVQAVDFLITDRFANDYPRMEKKRREFYGRPGAYRLHPHGLEFRTPSNMWLAKESYLNYVARIVFQLPGYARKMIKHQDSLDQAKRVGPHEYRSLLSKVLSAPQFPYKGQYSGWIDASLFESMKYNKYMPPVPHFHKSPLKGD
jgi:hypothetical protein